jgi:uncharacterized protein (TIGR00725 family)
MPTVTLFGSARAEPGTAAYGEARRIGQRLAARGFVICNGGYGGTMAAAAEGARSGGGQVVGITLQGNARHENPHNTRVVAAESLMERIDALIRRGNAYVVFPGGTGTLAEIAVLLEYMNKRLISVRPVALLGDHWRPVLDALGEAKLFGLEPMAEATGCEVRGPVAVASDADAAVRFLCAALDVGESGE